MIDAEKWDVEDAKPLAAVENGGISALVGDAGMFHDVPLVDAQTDSELARAYWLHAELAPTTLPTLAPVLDTVEVHLEFVSHLLQCQILRQPEHPLRAHPCAGMRMVNYPLAQRPALLDTEIQFQPRVCHHPDR